MIIDKKAFMYGILKGHSLILVGEMMERLNDKSKTKVLEVKVDESQLYIHGENFDIEKKLENLFIGNSKPGEYLEIVYTDSKERDPPTYRIFLK